MHRSLCWFILLGHLDSLLHGNDKVSTGLQELYQDFYSWRLEDSPEFATYVGTYRYNDRLQSFNLTRAEHRFYQADTFLYSLSQLNTSSLSQQDRLNYRILYDMLYTFTEGYKWSLFGSINPMNFLEGNQLDPVHQVEATPFFTRGDYENYIARLRDTPTQFSEYAELFAVAVDLNRTSHNVSVNRVPEQIGKLLTVAEDTAFYQPFRVPLQRLPIHDADKHDLQERGKRAIEGVLNGFRRMKEFLEMEYIPYTRAGWGVGSLEHGKEYYKACLKWHLSTDLSPEDVHNIGLREVDRIVSLMQQVMRRQGFNGSVADYFGILKNDTSLHMETEEEVLKGFQQIVNERVKPRLAEMFNNLPNLPVRVEPMPYDGPGGQYISGSEDGSRAGIFMVNLFRPKETGTYVMVPITLHESIPGHHLQASYALKANLPNFRRNMELTRYYEIPYHFPVYTAYIEGWALYAESLGEELGLYRYDHELMGRYSLEMFRACRLVVDSGLHYYGWERETAIQYMLNYTSFSRAEMSIEVDRYITWPGQACAYKIGEIKIKELRKKAENDLGDEFDIKAFHSVVLENGPMPLHILEEVVADWVSNFTPTSRPDVECHTDGSSTVLPVGVLSHTLLCLCIMCLTLFVK